MGALKAWAAAGRHRATVRARKRRIPEWDSRSAVRSYCVCWPLLKQQRQQRRQRAGDARPPVIGRSANSDRGLARSLSLSLCVCSKTTRAHVGVATCAQLVAGGGGFNSRVEMTAGRCGADSLDGRSVLSLCIKGEIPLHSRTRPFLLLFFFFAVATLAKHRLHIPAWRPAPI